MNVIMLLSVSILFAVTNNLLLHGINNKWFRGMGDTLFFNALVSVVWLAILLILNKGIKMSTQSWLWGIGYGSIMSAFLLCKMQAMATGPVSVTSFIGCSSLIISTAFGVLFFHEKVSILQIAGVACLILALFLTVFKSEKKPAEKTEKTWFLWCSLFFICSGVTGIVFKLHQASRARDEINQMMLAAAITSIVLFFILSLIIQRKKDKTFPRISSPACIFVIACGIVSCGYNRLNIGLSGMIPSIVFFPVFNGSVIFLASLFAAILFREKITKRQMTGIIIGVTALLMTSGGV
ncbi:MAG: EamA family transporter [Clostridia bacterium]|nr:EamA family transporter [Clostridia bacterium]